MTDDRLLIERSGARGALAAVVVGKSVGRALAVYTLIVLLLVGFGAWLVFRGAWPLGMVQFLLAAVLLRGVIRSRGLSAVPEIPLADIERIEAHRPLQGVTRGHFVVHFQQRGRSCKRVIVLPGILENGAEEFHKAVEMLAERGLLEGEGETC